MTCRRPRYPPHAHTVKCLMPVMISPRSARDSLRVPCLQLSGPHLKCTFSQHTLRGGVPLKLGGLLISASNLSSRPDQNGPRPQVQRSRAKGPEPQEKTWLTSSVKSPQWLRLEKEVFVGDEATWSAGRVRLSVCLPACLPLPALPRLQPSGSRPHHHQPGGFVPSWLDCGVSSPLCLAYLGNSPCTFQPPTIVPTSPPSLPSMAMQGTRDLERAIAQPAPPPMQRANSEWDPVFAFRPSQPQLSRDSLPPFFVYPAVCTMHQNTTGCSDRHPRAFS